MKSFKFRGIASGDGESFCWLVNKSAFTMIKGREPNWYDTDGGYCRIYPDDLYDVDEEEDKEREIEIKIY